LILFFNIDEEYSNLGIKEFLKNDVTADYAIESEPTDLNICTGHRGYSRHILKTKRNSEHASSQTKQDNAIYKMAKLIQALEELGRSVNKKTNSILGSSSLAITQIKGGNAPNI